MPLSPDTSNDEFIVKHYFRWSALRIARELGITKSKVLRRARALSLPKKSSGVFSLQDERYTEDDENAIRGAVEARCMGELAKQMGRTTSGLKRKASRMGIKVDERNFYSEAEDEMIMSRPGEMTWAALGKTLGRTGEAVRARYKLIKKKTPSECDGVG